MGLLASFVAIFLVSYGAATIGGDGKYDRSIMASWMQAIGSVAAIAGALWLGFRGDRLKKSADLEAACITAIGMIQRLRVNERELSEITTRLWEISQVDGNPSDLFDLAPQLTDLRKWSYKEELAVIPLGDRCAANLAMSRDRIYLAAAKVRQYADRGQHQTPQGRKDFARGLKADLDDVLQLLTNAANTCEHAANRL